MKGDLESLIRGPTELSLSQRIKFARDAAKGFAILLLLHATTLSISLNRANISLSLSLSLSLSRFHDV